jgi:5-formyltetrahydrofolate cyclo-ligase
LTAISAKAAAISSTMTKDDLRAAVLAKRDALSEAERRAGAQAVALAQLPSWRPGTIVAGYAPIRSEIDPFPLMRALAEKGAALALPAIIQKDHVLVFRAWRLDDPFEHGPFGIRQPAATASETNPDIVLVPLAAFDRAGHRIGYGRGYYDRTIGALRQKKAVTTIGLGFSVQEIASVPALGHDEPLDFVLTERELIPRA